MTYDVEAIYVQGVFRPLRQLAISDGERVHLRVLDKVEDSETDESALDVNARRRAKLDELRRIMAELPTESPDDGFSGADHDQVLYGKP